jgi:hypothetical protein
MNRENFLLIIAAVIFLTVSRVLGALLLASTIFFSQMQIILRHFTEGRLQKKESETLFYLLLLELRAGNSCRTGLERLSKTQLKSKQLRQQIEQALSGTESTKRAKTDELVSVQDLSECLGPSALERIRFFNRRNRNLTKLKALRDQAMGPIYSQVVLIGLLYLGLLARQVAKSSLLGLQRPYWLSLLLMIIGLVVLFHLPKRFKWKH